MGLMAESIIKPLSGSVMERVANYRNKAEELRVILEDLLVHDLRQTLRRIATEYDTMARTLARMHDESR
ncbi:MAG: hypothetical protein JO208_12920 [Alphaproteobacteria bacterium]|nr:hypothetical protein [Alphaproteobacteria bacterium]